MNDNWLSHPTAFGMVLNLARDGYSANQIAKVISEEFHTFFSRNSIIGKLKRMGHNLGEVNGRSPMKTGSRHYKESNPKPRKVVQTFKPIEKEEAIIPLENNYSPYSNASFGVMKVNCCKWPVGDDLYCGAPTEIRTPYCKVHTTVAKREGRR